MNLTKIEQLDELQEKIMGQACTCASINRRAAKLDPAFENLACCPKCCYCHWDRASER